MAMLNYEVVKVQAGPTELVLTLLIRTKTEF